MHSTMKQIATEMAMLGHFWAFHETLKFYMIGLGHEMKLRNTHFGLEFGGLMQCTMKRITEWNAHAQLTFAFSDPVRPRMLTFSERFAYITIIYWH